MKESIIEAREAVEAARSNVGKAAETLADVRRVETRAHDSIRQRESEVADAADTDAYKAALSSLDGAKAEQSFYAKVVAESERKHVAALEAFDTANRELELVAELHVDHELETRAQEFLEATERAARLFEHMRVLVDVNSASEAVRAALDRAPARDDINTPVNRLRTGNAMGGGRERLRTEIIEAARCNLQPA